LKNNWQIFKISDRGIDFLGYKFFHKFKLLRKTIKIKFIKLINKIKKFYNTMKPCEIINGIMSYYGWLKYGNCMNLRKKYIDDDLMRIINNVCYKNNIKNPLNKIYL
jgi:hypothetical protein